MTEAVKDDLEGVEAFITLREACQITGYHPKYMAALCRDGKAPCYQRIPGADYRFIVSELQAWMRGK